MLNIRSTTKIKDCIGTKHGKKSGVRETSKIKHVCIWIFFVMGLLSYTQNGTAQEVQIILSYDTVYMGNVLGVQFTMKNWQGDLSNPDFGEFAVVGGPQISSSMSYSGGQRTSTKSILFYLKPPDRAGIYQLPEQSFQADGEEVITETQAITVLENPDQLEQNPAIKKQPSRSFNKEYKRSPPPRGQRQRF